MKKAIIFTLTALLLISSMAACGSKDNTRGENPAQSRVLYSEFETDVNEESEEDDKTEDEKKEDNTTTAANRESSAAAKKKVTTRSTASTKSGTASDSASSGDIKSKRAASSSSTASVRSSSSSANTSSQTSSATLTVQPSNNNVAARTPTGAGVSSGSNYQETSHAESSKLPDSDVKSTDTDTAADTDITLDTDTETDSEIVEEPPVAVGSFDASDLTVSFAAGSVNFGDDIEDVKTILGEPIDVKAAQSCKYSGQLDKTFVFSECTINTYPNEDGSKDYVVGIVIKSGEFTTAKGAKIGTTSDELIAMYGYSTSDDSPMRKYISDDKTLSFYMENDVVAEIDYIWNN